MGLANLGDRLCYDNLRFFHAGSSLSRLSLTVFLIILGSMREIRSVKMLLQTFGCVNCYCLFDKIKSHGQAHNQCEKTLIKDMAVSMHEKLGSM